MFTKQLFAQPQSQIAILQKSIIEFVNNLFAIKSTLLVFYPVFLKLGYLKRKLFYKYQNPPLFIFQYEINISY